MALAPNIRPGPDIATPIPHSLSSYSMSGAVTAGVIASVVFSGLLWIARLMGITNFSISLSLGSMFTGDETVGTLWLGLLINIVLGVLAAMVYALLFHSWGWATWARGVAIGMGHAVLAGVLMLGIPRVHPGGVNQVISDPGFLGANAGWMTAVGVFFLFLIYGAIVGEVYSRYVPHLSPATPEARRPLP